MDFNKEIAATNEEINRVNRAIDEVIVFRDEMNTKVESIEQILKQRQRLTEEMEYYYETKFHYFFDSRGEYRWRERDLRDEEQHFKSVQEELLQQQQFLHAKIVTTQGFDYNEAHPVQLELDQLSVKEHSKLNVQHWIAVNEEEVRKVKVAIDDVVSSINETKANIEAFEQESQEQLRARTMSYYDITSKYRNDDLSSFRAREEVLRKKEGNLRKDTIILLKQQMIEMQRLAKRYDDSEPQRKRREVQLEPEQVSLKKNATQYLRALKQVIRASFETTLSECLIDIPVELASYDLGRTKTLDLTFLDPLRLEDADECFLPKKIFVRKCMKDRFQEIRHNIVIKQRKPGRYHTVLTGSPGVGTSILSFLAALYHAQFSRVVYCRRTPSEPGISVFVMGPNGHGSVCVMFARNMGADPSHSQLSIRDIYATMVNFDREGRVDWSSIDHAYTYVDGPNPTDDANTLRRRSDFFCMSGEYPLLDRAREESIVGRLLLTGWTKEEAINGLREVYNIPRKSAIRVYNLCGGSIGKMIRACKSYDEVEQETDKLVELLSEQQIDIVRYRWSGRADNNSVKGIRTTFLLDGPPSVSFKMVDSIYVLNKMCLNVLFENWLEAYGLSKRMGNGALQAVCFKRCIHAWFQETKPSPITGIYLSQGNSIMEAVKELNAPNVYWIPNAADLPNVDSVLVLGNTLYAFQFICKNHPKHFDPESFLNDFVKKIQSSFMDQLPQVHVIFVVPHDSAFELPATHPCITFSRHIVDTKLTHEYLVRRSMKLLPFLTSTRT